MKLFWCLLIVHSILLSMDALATVISAHVYKIDVSDKIHEPSLVFLNSGEVVKLIPHKTDYMRRLVEARDLQTKLALHINEDREIIHIEISPDLKEMRDLDKLIDESNLVELARPTVVSQTGVLSMFKSARLNNKHSQCFNRAHVWSYEWKKFKNINTAKLFIFFSVKYIREHNFYWWFHVAPYAHVVIGNKIRERVMDKKFMPGPSSIRQWIDRFMADGTPCRTVKKYSEYANYPESGDCYLMRSSMFTYWPFDLEMEELKGIVKKDWARVDLEAAYTEAFDISMLTGELR